MKLTPDRFAFGLPAPALLSPDKQLPGLGTESEFDRFGDGLPKMTGPGLRGRLPGRSDSSDPIRTPENVLMDMVAQFQLEVEAMKCGTPGHQTLDRPTSPVRTRLVVFTSTRVPKFAGVTIVGNNTDRCLPLSCSQMGGVMPPLLCNCCST